MEPVARSRILPLIFFCFATACAAKQRPIVYPNDHLRQVGQEAARADVDACLDLADEHEVVSDATGTAIQETTADTATGMATGAATGALGGGGVGAVAGVLRAGIQGMTRGLSQPRKPDPTFRSFVEQCLTEKGYELVGWQ